MPRRMGDMLSASRIYCFFRKRVARTISAPARVAAVIRRLAAHFPSPDPGNKIRYRATHASRPNPGAAPRGGLASVRRLL